MDSNDLLQFNTLHELQKNSSEAFGSNPLFGTHNGKEEGGEFEWTTYEEWGRKVDACRTVLKDTCGEFALELCWNNRKNCRMPSHVGIVSRFAIAIIDGFSWLLMGNASI